MNVLIIGGSAGLGLEIGVQLKERGYTVHTTGRRELNITSDLNDVRHELDNMISKIPTVDLLVYAAGFTENGHIEELSDEHISQMINVGIATPALLLQRIIRKQKILPGFIAITSTSQWIPRELEPVYTGVKAGLAMLAQSISLDPSVKKTLVAGPAGMNTNFWAGTGRDASALLPPSWVAEKILELWDKDYTYRLARILRDPTPESERVQILETRA